MFYLRCFWDNRSIKAERIRFQGGNLASTNRKTSSHQAEDLILTYLLSSLHIYRACLNHDLDARFRPSGHNLCDTSTALPIDPRAENGKNRRQISLPTGCTQQGNLGPVLLFRRGSWRRTILRYATRCRSLCFLLFIPARRQTCVFAW
jgi:hypothetical protein